MPKGTFSDQEIKTVGVFVLRGIATIVIFAAFAALLLGCSDRSFTEKAVGQAPMVCGQKGLVCAPPPDMPAQTVAIESPICAPDDDGNPVEFCGPSVAERISGNPGETKWTLALRVLGVLLFGFGVSVFFVIALQPNREESMTTK